MATVREAVEEKRKKNKNNEEEKKTSLSVREAVEQKRNSSLSTNNTNKKPTFDYETGKKGWQKYLDDKASSEQKKTNEREEEKWWETLGRWLGDTGPADTTLPLGNTSQIINDVRNDTSYQRPNDGWSEDQQYEFGALYLESPSKAYAYAEKINNENNKAKEAAEIEKIQRSATSSDGGKFGHTLGAIATAPLGMADYLNMLVMANAGRDPSASDGIVSPFEYSQAVTEGVATDLNNAYGTLDESIPIIGGKGWGDVYGLGVSIAQSAASAYTLGPAGTLVSYFGQGAASGMKDALDRGAEDWQAALYGAALGAFEGIAEQIGIDNLFKIGSSSTIKGLIKNIVKQAGAEGAEEGLTTFLSTIADDFIMQDKSQLNQMVAQYMAQGMSEEEAKKQATKDIWSGLAYDALAGAVSGGVHGGASTSIQTGISNYYTNKYFGNQAQDIVNDALNSPHSDVQAIGQKYQNQLDSGKKLSGWNLNELIEVTDTDKIKNAVLQRLGELGETSDVTAVADALIKQAMGEELSSKDQNILNKSKYGNLVATELSEDNIKSGGLTNNWAAEIGTRKANPEVYNKAQIDATKELVNKIVTKESKYNTSESGKTTLGDQEVSIQGVESIKGGEVTVRLESGETVNASDLKLSDKEALMYDIISRMDATPDTANQILSQFKPTSAAQASMYYNSIPLAYEYGKINYEAGLKNINMPKHLKNSVFTRGRIDAMIQAEAKTPKTNSAQKESNKTKSGIIYESGFTYDESTANELQQVSMAHIEVINKMSSLEIHVYESKVENVDGKNKRVAYIDGKRIDPAPNGFFKDGNKIYIDFAAGNKGEGAMLYAMSHEITHYIRAWNAKGFKELGDFLLEQYGKKGVNVDYLLERQRQKIEKRYEKEGKALPSESKLNDMAYEEMVADAMSDMLTDPKAYEKLAKLKQQNKTLWEKVGEAIKAILDKFKEALGIYKEKDVAVAEETNKVREFSSDVYDKLQDLYIKAFVVADANYEASEGSTKTTGEDAKHSDRDSDYLDAVNRGDMVTAQKMVDEAAREAGYTIKAYHGTSRGDRVGNVFLPKRATSGPMPFFTDNKDIADNYARNKADTSLAYDTEYDSYYTQFRVNRNGKNISIPELWNYLSFAERNRIKEKAKHIKFDDDYENIIVDTAAEHGNGAWDAYTLNMHKGNALEALVDTWLESGDLFNSEADFIKVLELVGIKDVEYRNPDARYEKTYDTWLKIQKPFDTDNANQYFYDSLSEWIDNHDMSIYEKETSNADLWDKNNQSPESWLDKLAHDIENGTTHAWTVIPDFVTDYLKQQDHDGIKDKGGKGGGAGHTVWIPFSSEQIKSADPVTYDKDGKVIPLSERFKSDNDDIRYSERNIPLTDSDLDAYMRTGKTLHTRNKKTRMLEVGKKPILTSSLETSNFISDAIHGKAPGEVRAFGKVGGRLAISIMEVRHNLNLYGKYLELNADDLRESHKRHSSPKEKGDIALTDQDFERIPEYMDEFDGILSVNTYNGKTEIHLYKKVNDDYIRVLTVSSNERDSLQVTKLIGVSKEKFEEKYAKKIERATGSSRSQNDSNPSTKARHTAGALSDSIIPQNENSVNREFSDFEEMLFQERDPNATSNRTLLANALETAAQNDIEKAKLKLYKEKIALIESEQKKLTEIRAEIKELSFAKGPRDTAKIRDLQDTATKLANRINTYDRQLLNLESTTALKGVLQREKQMAYNRAKKEGQAALRRQKERDAQTVRELMNRHQESRQKATEGRNKTAVKLKIKKVVHDLNKLLLNPTKDQHVPIGLQRVVAEALDTINMDTMNAEERVAYYNDLISKSSNPDEIAILTQKRDFFEYRDANFKERITELKNAYAEFKESDDPLIRNAHNDAIADLIKNTADEVGNKSLKDMSLSQLERVYDMYKAILATVRNSNKLFKEGRQETVTDNSDSVKLEVREVGGHKDRVLKMTKFLKKFGWDMLKPVTAMKVIGSKTLARLFDNVRAAEDTWAVDVNEAKQFYDDIAEKYGYNKWDLKKHYTFKDSAGTDISITLEQIMSLYAYSKRDQADKHLEDGGFVFDDAIEVVEKKLGIPLKYEVNDANPYRLRKEHLLEITNALTKEQKDFVDAMQTYLSDVMGAKGNEVSLAMYDIKLYKEKNYFPLKTSRYFREFDPEKSATPKIKNSGFSKKTVPQAGNPIVLSNFMDVWAGHVNDMSMYHAFVLPLEDFMRVYNYSSTTGGYDSVQQYIKNAYGVQANQYIEKLMDDLNGGARVDSSAGIINKGLSLFKKASVFASASVVVQQPSAIARALAYIDPKYFAKATPEALNIGKHKTLWAEVKKYAPVAVIKEMGYFDTGVGRSTVDWIKGNQTIKDKMDDVLSKAPALADELCWVHIWEAVKRETKATSNLKVNSEEFFERCGKRFTEVITNTQVYDSVLSRSGMMRSKDTGMKMATAFMAEPTTTVNMMVDGIIQGKRGNKKFTASTVGAVAASIILNSILVALVYAARDDDEDETYLEKYIGSLTSELLDGFNPLTYIPFVKDVWSIAQGYDVERSDMSVVSKLWESIESLFNENKSGLDKVLEIAGSVSSLFGIPLKNIIRDAKGMYNLTNTIMSDIPTTEAGIKEVIEDSLKSSIPLWDRLHESDSKGDKLYEAIISGDQNQIDRVKATYKSEQALETALKTALRENDSRINEAAQARLDGNISEYTRIAREIIAEGHFSQDTVVAAINAEMNAIKKAQSESIETEPTDDKDEATSIYRADDINIAFDNGDKALALSIIDELIDMKVANGMDEAKAKSSLRSSMTSYWKPLYIAASKSGNKTEMQRIKQILYNSGLYGSASEVVKAVNGWLK